MYFSFERAGNRGKKLISSHISDFLKLLDHITLIYMPFLNNGFFDFFLNRYCRNFMIEKILWGTFSEIWKHKSFYLTEIAEIGIRKLKEWKEGCWRFEAEAHHLFCNLKNLLIYFLFEILMRVSFYLYFKF